MAAPHKEPIQLKQQVEWPQETVQDDDGERRQAMQSQSAPGDPEITGVTSLSVNRSSDDSGTPQAWTCPWCTLFNDERRTTCEVCEGQRVGKLEARWDVSTFKRSDIACD